MVILFAISFDAYEISAGHLPSLLSFTFSGITVYLLCSVLLNSSQHAAIASSDRPPLYRGSSI